jgi:hypothetical protein
MPDMKTWLDKFKEQEDAFGTLTAVEAGNIFESAERMLEISSTNRHVESQRQAAILILLRLDYQYLIETTIAAGEKPEIWNWLRDFIYNLESYQLTLNSRSRSDFKEVFASIAKAMAMMRKKSALVNIGSNQESDNG